MLLSQLHSQDSATTVSSEMELLLCCARTEIEGKTVERIKCLLDRGIDFEELTALTSKHRVKPLLHHNLNKHASDKVSQSYLRQIKQDCRHNSWRNMSLMNQLTEILELLEANGIKAIAFKGPVLAASAYGNLSLRRIKDLDLLVEELDFQRTVDLFIGLGYKLIVKAAWEFHLESSDGSYSIDLHREIIPQHLSCPEISDYAWKNLEYFSFQGQKIPTLTPEACLLILCLNGTKDYWQRLNRVCDVAELIRSQPNLDWQEVWKQAERMGFKRLLFLSLFFARNLLGAKIPDFIEQKMQLDPALDSLALKVYKKLFSRTWKPCETVESTVFHIKNREQWRDKIQCFWSLIKLSDGMNPSQNDRDFLPLPKSLHFTYYLIRPFRIIGKYTLWKK